MAFAAQNPHYKTRHELFEAAYDLNKLLLLFYLQRMDSDLYNALERLHIIAENLNIAFCIP